MLQHYRYMDQLVFSMHLQTDSDGVVENVDYGADVVLSVLLPEEKAAVFAAHILDATAGTVEALEAGEAFKDVPWREPITKE